MVGTEPSEMDGREAYHADTSNSEFLHRSEEYPHTPSGPSHIAVGYLCRIALCSFNRVLVDELPLFT
jgi:hypothetical protein